MQGVAAAQSTVTPWYQKAYRWGQTNITEKDPIRYDIPWWRQYWKRTAVQAVIINAGGIVAYYPSKFPLHYRAEFLNGRDLYGELAKAAHDDGIYVMARMDSNRTTENFYQAHPDWFAIDSEGKPYRAADKYITCINSPYYDEYLQEVLREIITRSQPEGITDNSWAGMGRENICYCDNCRRKFRTSAGADLPRKADWDDKAYRDWILWSYARRTELWELNNKTTQAAGGRDCIWSGMNSGSVSSQARSFRDLPEICKRAKIMMLDHQRRDDETGFQQNGDTGKRVHGLLGWDKLAPESMATYESGPGYYRLAAKPAAEARMWMIAGIAGGIQPWWHFIGSYHEDRRAFESPVPVMNWCKANQQYLVNRQPVASVGLVWSQRNTDFYGRDDAAEAVDAPYTGFMHALVRARIPYLPVHIDEIEKQGSKFSALILPNIGAMSDSQCAAIRRFVVNGGSIFATGDTSLYNEFGDARQDFALADLFAAHRPTPAPKLSERSRRKTDPHTYLRLAHPHAVLKGFDQTDIVAYGSSLGPLRVDPAAKVPITFIPPFPTYPPETSWMRVPKTDIPGLVLHNRCAYMPADLDRRYAKEHLPDHGDLLANIVRWLAKDTIPLSVEGPGLIDCHLYKQDKRTILHLVNLTSAGTWRAPVEELIPVGPIKVRIKTQARVARLLVSGRSTSVSAASGQIVMEIGSIKDHEVIVLE